MIPVLFKIDPGAQYAWVMYLVAVGLAAYAAWSGWRGAVGPYNAKKGEYAPATTQDKLLRGGGYGITIAVLSWFGLKYVLPASAISGGKGEGIPIHSYGILLAGGFMSAVALSAALAQREWPGEEGLKKREQVWDLAFWVFFASMAGARLLFLLVNWKDFSLKAAISDPFSNLILGGVVFYGGLIGGVVAAVWYCRKEQMSFMRLADVAMPTISLGQCFGRLGCFGAGCCWGDIAAEGTKLAVHLPGAGIARNLFGQLSHTASLAYASQAGESARWVNAATGEVFNSPVDGAVLISKWVQDHGHTLAIHPTQLYEAAGQLFLMVAFLWLRGRRRFHGQLLGLWLMAYAVLRTTVELFRGDAERGTLHGLVSSVPLSAWYNISTSQFIALFMFALGASILYRNRAALFAPVPAAAPAGTPQVAG